MYNKLKRMYLEGRLDEQMLVNAVSKGWISEEQRLEIIQLKVDSNKNLSDSEVIRALV